MPIIMFDLELHCHTRYSPDSLVRLQDLINRAREVGLHKLAITDHSEIEGALLAQQMAPELIIVGEEAMTRHGEMLCYYITELVPDDLDLEAAIDFVHEQGGICGPSHPLDPRRHGIGREKVLEYYAKFDFIEVFNARTRDHKKNDETHLLAERLDVPGIACSDAHTLQEVGISRTRFPHAVENREDFLRVLPNATLVPIYSSPMTSAGSLIATIAHKAGLDKKT
jgi:predicted metal-dependent phosphoesterase TrpH